jgi:hypothetical protein
MMRLPENARDSLNSVTPVVQAAEDIDLRYRIP